MNYVWYLSYGSNIKKERFLCYIKGGTAKGALTSEEGSKDDTDPIKIKSISLDRKLYFSKSAKRWQDKGVCFLDKDIQEEKTLCRMYLVTEEQFLDVVKQENKLSVHETLDINFIEVNKLGFKDIINGWYGRILYLGDDDGFPIYTFTSPDDFDEEKVTSPSCEYVHMIASGIKESYDMTIEEISEYFLGKSGIKNCLDKDIILNCLNNNGEL